MGFVTTLTLILIVLKALGLIAWPWVWVLCPVWLAALLAGAVFLLILVEGRIKTGSRWPDR